MQRSDVTEVDTTVLALVMLPLGEEGKEQLRNPSLLDLPEEVLLCTLSFLDAAHLILNLQLVCKFFLRLTRDPALWKQLYKQRFSFLLPWIQLRQQEQKSKVELGVPDPLKSEDETWLNEYRWACAVEQNWQSGKYIKRTSIRLGREYNNATAVTPFHSEGQTFAMASFKSATVGVYSLPVTSTQEPSLIHTLECEARIPCLHFANNILAVGQTTGAVEVWAVDSGEHRIQFEKQSDWVESIKVAVDFQNRIISGCASGAIALWDLETEKCERILEGHTSNVLGFEQANQTLVSGSLDKSIRIWDLRTETDCLKLLADRAIKRVHYDGQYFVLSSASGRALSTWDLRMKKVIEEFVIHKSWLTDCYMRGNRIATCSHDATVHIWQRTEDDKLIQETAMRIGDAVQQVRFDELRMLCGVSGAVHIYDFAP